MLTSGYGHEVFHNSHHWTETKEGLTKLFHAGKAAFAAPVFAMLM